MIRAEIIKCRTENINKTKDQFFEKINKVNKPLVRLTKEERERRLKVLTQGWRKDIILDVAAKKKKKKELKESITNTCVPVNHTNRMKRTNS